MGIRVLIVDDHSVVRQGLRMFLNMDPELEIVGEASNGREAVSQAVELSPDVILMDLVMPEMNGIEATRIIRENSPEIEVIALTSVLEDQSIFKAINAGAIGYLLKDTEAQDLQHAIKNAAMGKVQLSSEIAAKLVEGFHPPASHEKLTPREEEVLILLAKGKSNKDIGDSLYLSIPTVKTHVSNILRKLSVPGRTQAALYAVRAGIVSLEDTSHTEGSDLL